MFDFKRKTFSAFRKIIFNFFQQHNIFKSIIQTEIFLFLYKFIKIRTKEVKLTGHSGV